MNKSKAEFFIRNGDKSPIIIWKTDIGRVAIIQDKIDINSDLEIY
jgi:hypothetical protein